MSEIQIYQAFFADTPEPAYIFATDFPHASTLIAAHPEFSASCAAGTIVMTNVTRRLRQGPMEVAKSTWMMQESGFTGVATYDRVAGWQPRGDDNDEGW
jgi:hypothetical protein